MSKQADCFDYLCEHQYGLTYLLNKLADKPMSPQLFCFYDLLCDIIFANISFRKTMYQIAGL